MQENSGCLFLDTVRIITNVLIFHVLLIFRNSCFILNIIFNNSLALLLLMLVVTVVPYYATCYQSITGFYVHRCVYS